MNGSRQPSRLEGYDVLVARSLLQMLHEPGKSAPAETHPNMRVVQPDLGRQPDLGGQREPSDRSAHGDPRTRVTRSTMPGSVSQSSLRSSRQMGTRSAMLARPRKQRSKSESSGR